MSMSDQFDQTILASGGRLSRYLVRTLTRLETFMTELNDKVDAALELLKADDASEQARTDAAVAAAAVLQEQVTTLSAGKAVDEAQLQKVLDVLNSLANPLVTGGSATPAAPVPAQPAPLVTAVPPQAV